MSRFGVVITLLLLAHEQSQNGMKGALAGLIRAR